MRAVRIVTAVFPDGRHVPRAGLQKREFALPAVEEVHPDALGSPTAREPYPRRLRCRRRARARGVAPTQVFPILFHRIRLLWIHEGNGAMPRLRWRFRARPLPGVDPGQNARNAARQPEPFLRNAGKQMFRDGGGRKPSLAAFSCRFHYQALSMTACSVATARALPPRRPSRAIWGTAQRARRALDSTTLTNPTGIPTTRAGRALSSST